MKKPTTQITTKIQWIIFVLDITIPIECMGVLDSNKTHFCVRNALSLCHIKLYTTLHLYTIFDIGITLLLPLCAFAVVLCARISAITILIYHTYIIQGCASYHLKAKPLSLVIAFFHLSCQISYRKMGIGQTSMDLIDAIVYFETKY